MCINCAIRDYFAKQGVWLHWSREFKATTEYKLDLHGPFSLTSRTEYLVPREKKYGKHMKPLNATWFSHGTWLFNPYNDEGCTDENQFIGESVICITTPPNVLVIKTAPEMRDFISEFKYGEYIDWDLVAEKYSGVAFEFRRITDIGMDIKEAWWHCGFDVESLVMFDIGNTPQFECLFC